MAALLEYTSAACSRLEKVEYFELILSEKATPCSLDKLWPAIATAFPQMDCFAIVIAGLDRKENAPLISACFTAIGQHMPNLKELRVEMAPSTFEGLYLDTAVYAVDWAASLPPGLRRLCLPQARIHHELLQHLAQMHSLVELSVKSISSYVPYEPDYRTVQSEACAWQVLELCQLPDFQDILRFTVWPHVQLKYNIDADDCHQWRVEHGCDGCSCKWKHDWLLAAPGPEQRQAVAEAATRLSACVSGGPLDWGGAFGFGWKRKPYDAADFLGLISALAPVADMIPSLCLDYWSVTEALLDEVSQALPHTHRVIFQDCTFTSEAWLRMLTLESVTEFSFCTGRCACFSYPNRVSLTELTTLAACVPRALTLEIEKGSFQGPDPDSGSSNEDELWDHFVASLGRRRSLLQLPPVTIK